ncbi:MAG: sugar transferase [Syntrophorhabdus aromaticivorans]|uniref:Sugar transferase n=1 Tax=Syntrophorhabdus aromaticivorans TaxID=328301 RepID=A0A971S102_9BACT|nr:sugar transferase [Syntrophorhabdus aromaticivorans]
MQNKYEKFGKRLFDIICSLCGIVILSPFLAVVSLVSKLDSPGPIFFVQKRMGRNLESFNLIKFRSMTVVYDSEKCQFNPGDESRVTRIGYFLRKTKIDELPELLNVLKGEMSFVGPRPEVLKYRHIYTGKFAPVLSLRPGITDFASIKYRNEEELLRQSPEPEKVYREVILPDKLALSLKYKETISFKTDLSIIFITLGRILQGTRCPKGTG